MENQADVPAGDTETLINSFREITSSSEPEAQFFLESHNFNLDSAVSTFLESNFDPPAPPPAENPHSPDQSQSYSPSASPSRSRSLSPPPPRRSSRIGGIRSLSDPNDGSDDDPDEPLEYYAGGQRSGMLILDQNKAKNDVDEIFNQARQLGAVEGSANLPSSSSRNFTGVGRRLTGETTSAPPPEVVTHTITFWNNGFTVDDGPLRKLDDPENASFLESIKKSEIPGEFLPADRKTKVHVNLKKKEGDCPEEEKRRVPFQGLGRALGSSRNAISSDPEAGATFLSAAPAPTMGLIVDQALPSTSIQLRLADGTRMVSRFNYHHTIQDIQGFIEASRPGGPRNFQLQTMGFPPKQLTDLDQTIEQAGLANSVVIQKL